MTTWNSPEKFRSAPITAASALAATAGVGAAHEGELGNGDVELLRAASRDVEKDVDPLRLGRGKPRHQHEGREKEQGNYQERNAADCHG